MVARTETAHRPLVGPMATVLFVCLHNAGRSQMSRALFERATRGRHRALSAGSIANPEGRVHPLVIEAMEEIGIDLSDSTPQRLTDELSSWPEALKRAGLTAQAPNFSVRKLPHWTPESVTAGLRKAQGLLEPGQSLTQRRLQQIAVQHEDIPGWSPVHRECQRQGIGFADLKAQAGIS